MIFNIGDSTNMPILQYVYIGHFSHDNMTFLNYVSIFDLVLKLYSPLYHGIVSQWAYYHEIILAASYTGQCSRCKASSYQIKSPQSTILIEMATN